MVLGAELGYQDRRRRSHFLFASFSFAHPANRMDNFVPPRLVFPTGSCGNMGRETESLPTKGLVKPIPKIAPASFPPWLPSKIGDYRGPKSGLRKSGQAITQPTRIPYQALPCP